MRVIITAQAQDRNRTLSIQVEEIMDERNPQKIKIMKETLNDFVPMGQSPQVQVQCEPEKLTTAEFGVIEPVSGNAPPSNQQKKQFANQPQKPELITASQTKYLRDLLKKHQIQEFRFCKDHNVDDIEHLSGKEARDIIGQLAKPQ